MVKKIIVFGSCNLDLFFDIPDMRFFVDTDVGAEDGLHLVTHKQAPGGKGANQAVAAAKAGGKVHYFGAIGKDGHAQYLLQNFRDLRINISGIAQVDSQTGLAAIFNTRGGKHRLVMSHGANTKATHKQVPENLLNKNALLVFQAETDLEQNAKLITRAKKKGAAVIYNIAPAAKIPAKVLAQVDYLILNRPEAEVVASNLGLSAKNLPLFAKTMAGKFDLACIITLGENGLIASRGEETPLKIPALSVKVIDSVGAGDAFVGAFAVALAEGLPFETALRHGAVGGSLACTRVGAQTALPTKREILKNLPKLDEMKRGS